MSPVPQQRSRADGFGALEDGAEGAGGAVPPAAVEADGEEVVGAVVGGGDGVEHLLDVAAAACSVVAPAGRAPVERSCSGGGLLPRSFAMLHTNVADTRLSKTDFESNSRMLSDLHRSRL